MGGYEDDTTSGVSRSELREATLRGVRWVAVGRVVAEVVTLGSSVVLARLIAPSEFGVVAIAIVLQGLAGVLAQQGVASALVQREHITREHVETSMALGLLVGAVATAVAYVTIPLFEPLFGEPATSVLQLSSLAFLVAGASATPAAMLQRRLDFKGLTTSEVGSTIVGVAVTLVMALAGYGAEAIITGTLVRMYAQAVQMAFRARPPLPRWHGRSAREIFGFGGYAALSSLGHQGFRNVDYAIVAAKLGLAQVGFYWRAYSLAFEYQAKISVVMQKMAFPVFSRSSDADDLRAMRFRIVRVHTSVIFPLLFGYVATAPVLVPWLYGAAWEPAVVPSQILAIAAFATPVMTGIGGVILAAGRARRMMVVNWAAAIGYALTILVAAPYGIIAVCWSVVGFQVLKVVLVHHFLMYQVVGIRVRELREEVLPAVIAGVPLLLIAAALVQGADGVGVPAPVAVAVATLTGGAIYLLILRQAFAETWADLVLLASRVAGGRWSARRGARPRAADPAPRVLLTNSVALNGGDAAIVEAMDGTLRRALGGAAQVTVSDSQPEAAARLYPHLRFTPWPWDVFVGTRSHRTLGAKVALRLHLARGYLGAFLHGRGLGVLGRLFLRPREQELLREYARAQVVVSKGGTYLVESYDLRPHLFDYRICLLLRRPLVLYTQSLGPFRDERNRRRLRRIFARADVMLRDERSLANLQALGVPPQRLHVYADPAFTLADPAELEAAGGSERTRIPRVAVSVREWRHFAEQDPEAGMRRYLDSMAAIVERLVRAHGSEVTLISTCQGVPDYFTDDAEVAARLAASLPRAVAARVTVDRGFHTTEALRARLREFDLAVATRMHFAILSLGCGTPVFPIAYEFKTSELFRRLGLEEWTLDIETIEPASAVAALDGFVDALPDLRPGLFRKVEAQRRAAESAGVVVRRAAGLGEPVPRPDLPLSLPAAVGVGPV